jgi:hypothetical protein
MELVFIVSDGKGPVAPHQNRQTARRHESNWCRVLSAGEKVVVGKSRGLAGWATGASHAMKPDSGKAAVDRSGSPGLAGRVARTFIDSKLTPLIVIASILLGAFAVVMLPREEEPQIKVPMVDVLVAMPGFSAKEVEERATRPMEKLLWEISGVEYIYSTSKSGESLVIVRFKVGEDMERSLVKLNQKLQQNFDRIPHGVSAPLVKARIH